MRKIKVFVREKIKKFLKIVSRERGKRGKKQEGKILPLILKKPEVNPIISPEPANGWEAQQTFNPGVILLDNKVHFLYRAIGEDGLSRLGYAVSSDGFHFDERLSYPVYEHQVKEYSFNIFSYLSGGSFGGAEDPRLVRVDEENVLYMTYTACDEGLRMALTSIKVDDFLKRNWQWKTPAFLSPPGEIHKNWVIFPEKINGQYAILHSLNPEIKIEYVNSLEFDDSFYIESHHYPTLKKRCWDGFVRGVGAPPIKTKYGWLVFYHAMNAHDFSKYKVGTMLLNLNEPTKILCRSKTPVLEPNEDYENNGSKPGVVYVTGAVVKDDLLLLYYGAADNYVGVAFAPFEEFLAALSKEEKPRLQRRLLKKKK